MPFPRSMARLAALTTTGLLAGVTLLWTGPAAEAATYPNGVCDVGEFCLYYNSSSYGYGSLYDYPWNKPRLYSTDTFVSAGAGQGQLVKNNAAAYWNRTQMKVDVYTGSGYSGSRGTVYPNSSGNFSAGYKNNVESFRFREV
jgi:hypothetical protein